VRVVADTNVLVSSLVFPGGRPEEVYRRFVDGPLRLVTSRSLLAELGRVLTDRCGWDETHAERALLQLARVADIVEAQENVAEISDGPSDDRVLEACIAGAADAIVSGDRHLLALGTFRGVPVVSPAALLARSS
jgi:putative PIN family toxin of toxin-antitoxin system